MAVEIMAGVFKGSTWMLTVALLPEQLFPLRTDHFRIVVPVPRAVMLVVAAVVLPIVAVPLCTLQEPEPTLTGLAFTTVVGLLEHNV